MSGGNVLCWGAGGESGLGNGATGNSATATSVHPSGTSGDFAGTNLFASPRGLNTCAQSGSNFYCWGDNTQGQFALGNTTESDNTSDQSNPARLMHLPAGLPAGLPAIRSMASGHNHLCLLFSDRKVRCAGHNTNGNLGVGFVGVFSSTTSDPNFVTGGRNGDPDWGETSSQTWSVTRIVQGLP